MAKKKIEDLTKEDVEKLCDKAEQNCLKCPLFIWGNTKDKFYCIGSYLDKLKQEIEVEE